MEKNYNEERQLLSEIITLGLRDPRYNDPEARKFMKKVAKDLLDDRWIESTNSYYRDAVWTQGFGVNFSVRLPDALQPDEVNNEVFLRMQTLFAKKLKKHSYTKKGYALRYEERSYNFSKTRNPCHFHITIFPYQFDKATHSLIKDTPSCLIKSIKSEPSCDATYDTHSSPMNAKQHSMTHKGVRAWLERHFIGLSELKKINREISAMAKEVFLETFRHAFGIREKTFSYHPSTFRTRKVTDYVPHAREIHDIREILKYHAMTHKILRKIHFAKMKNNKEYFFYSSQKSGAFLSPYAALVRFFGKYPHRKSFDRLDGKRTRARKSTGVFRANTCQKRFMDLLFSSLFPRDELEYFGRICPEILRCLIPSYNSKHRKELVEKMCIYGKSTSSELPWNNPFGHSYRIVPLYIAYLCECKPTDAGLKPFPELQLISKVKQKIVQTLNAQQLDAHAHGFFDYALANAPECLKKNAESKHGQLKRYHYPFLLRRVRQAFPRWTPSNLPKRKKANPDRY